MEDNQQVIREMLTRKRIPWRRLVSMGLDIEALVQEAGQAGDAVLVAKAEKALARREPSAAPLR